ncbi:MAG: transcription-repair coupling factor [Thermoleophilia bacterium]|nr:transcription-repair coupling factor [Thermoleophilia bacterium]
MSSTSSSHTSALASSSLEPVVGAAAATAPVIAWVTDVRTDTGAGHARVGEPLLPLLLPAANLGPVAPDGTFEPVETRPLLVVAPTDADAERIADAVGWYLGPGRAAPYVSRAVRYGSGVAPSPARIGAREHARRIARQHGVVVASVAALLERVPKLAARPEPVHVDVTDSIERDQLVRSLIDAGYERVEQADERGQMAVRGDIVDVYGTTAQYPVRIELFDDEIEAIRQFSPYTQRSLGPLTHVTFEPASEVRGMGSASDWWTTHSGDTGAISDPVIDFVEGELEAAWEAFTGTHLIIWEAAQTSREATDQVAELGASHVPDGSYVTGAAITDLLGAGDQLDPLGTGQTHQFEAQPPVFGSVGFAEAENELAGLIGRGMRTIITFPHAGHLGRISQQLRKVDPRELAKVPLRALAGDGDTSEHAVSARAAEAAAVEENGGRPEAWFAISPLAQGVVSRQLGIAIVPSGRLFRTRVAGQDPNTGAAGRIGQAMQAFTSLRVGDYVVHEDHGVARFAGFETKTVASVTRDYLKLDFSGADKVFVPHEQMGKVTRYVGADGGAPTLSKLGGKRWDLLRNRARQAVHELAGELLALYAKRARAIGHAFPEDEEVVERFEAAFPYEETEDQLTAIAAVKHDMEQPHPMDRLIVGDVGYGKTEVAMRAAMKAVAGGRQVMMLVPTTVLADQHLRSFRERIGELPVTVDMVSRFRTPKQTRQILEEFAVGKVDILIGTHRILSRDVLPKALGLVIVDEEQRFGVAQKELLRQMRLEVDVLSLSATPIPRTLHMSLAGIRDITVIETAPQGRRPIATHVGEYDEGVVTMAIERELEREGQVFILHNRVETIDEAAEKIRQMVPKARVAVGHGQMTEKQLEGVMMGLMRRDFDVLVATTIIESGLDVPDANTLVVDRADMLGMSQLYQIRGRVGRSSRSAHAYLFYPSARELTDEARARLTTLSDFTDLGSGSKIAMRDLELRGAGNLLGGEQSGHVAAIGFELYMDMLQSAVAEMEGTPIVAEQSALIETKLHAYVPADYVASEAIKIDVHRRIALAPSEDRLDTLVEELTDRFGELPEPVTNLVDLGRMRLLMQRLGARRLVVGPPRVAFGPVNFTSTQLGYLTADHPWAVWNSNSGELGARVTTREEAAPRAVELLRAAARVLGR